MPVSAGRAADNSLTASMPPADAPMPTMARNCASGLVADSWSRGESGCSLLVIVRLQIVREFGRQLLS